MRRAQIATLSDADLGTITPTLVFAPSSGARPWGESLAPNGVLLAGAGFVPDGLDFAIRHAE